MHENLSLSRRKTFSNDPFHKQTASSRQSEFQDRGTREKHISKAGWTKGHRGSELNIKHKIPFYFQCCCQFLYHFALLCFNLI